MLSNSIFSVHIKCANCAEWLNPINVRKLRINCMSSVNFLKQKPLFARKDYEVKKMCALLSKLFLQVFFFCFCKIWDLAKFWNFMHILRNFLQANLHGTAQNFTQNFFSGNPSLNILISYLGIFLHFFHQFPNSWCK